MLAALDLLGEAIRRRVGPAAVLPLGTREMREVLEAAGHTVVGFDDWRRAGVGGGSHVARAGSSFDTVTKRIHPMTQTNHASRGALLACATSLAVLLCTDADAKDSGMGASMIRVLACDGVDAKMEVYLPESLVIKGYQAVRKMKPTIGWYTLT